MRYGWLFVIPVLGLVIIVAIAVIRFKLEKPRKIDKLAVLAHTEPIKNLPEYKNAQKQHVLYFIHKIIYLRFFEMILKYPVLLSKTTHV